ncbi:MAG: response regulator [Armatimonadia bacterium]|nr:response regulator [Armatimonadia bacterium]
MDPRRILDSITDHIVVKDTDRRILWANAAFADYMGQDRQALVGLLCPHRGHERCADCPFDDVVTSGRPVSTVVRTDKMVDWDVTAYPIIDDAGSVVGVVEVSRDITQDRLAEREQEQRRAEMARTQRMESIGRLAGGVAHDLSNVVSPILGYAELMLRQDPGEEVRRRRLGEIATAARRARELIAQVLTFAHGDESAAEATDMPAAIEQAMGLMQSTLPPTVEPRYELADQPLMAAIPPGLTNQLVVGVCAAVAEAMEPTGGVITIGLSQASVSHDLGRTLGLPGLGPYARVTVATDPHGGSAGTPEPDLRTLRQLIADRGGAVTAYRDGSGGITTHLYLPLVDDATGPHAGAPVQQHAGDEKLLVVDDEPSVTLMASEMLRALGYSVTTASDPREALRLLRRDPSAVDLIMTDQAMPHMTGLELASNVRVLRQDLPVIISTGVMGVEGLVDAAEDYAFLAKPYSMGELAAAVRRCLDDDERCAQGT